jgi:tetratricopeptide (TPR) repeat protein
MEGSNTASNDFTYPAFISYSHVDERSATRLRKGIERYRVPKPLVGRVTRYGPIPRRIPRVFRDRDEFPAAPDLSAAVRDALAQSAHLIVVCSPAAVQSLWVNQEIIEFKRLGRVDRILPLIVDGEPHAATPGRECFPPALRFQVDADGRLTDQPATEPIAADLRPGADGEENAKLKLIAGLLGVGYDELRQRQLIAERRRIWFWRGIAAAGFLLAALATAGGWRASQYAQYSDGLLSQAIKISTQQVSGAVHVADQQGVSREAIDDLLNRAKGAFEGLVAQTVDAPWVPWRAEAPWLPWHQSAPPARLRGAKAILLLASADHEGKVGNIEQQRQTAEQARVELERVSEEEPADPEWRAQLALAQDLIAGAWAAQWQVDRALEEYRKALAIREKLASGDKPRWQRELALSHTDIGDMLWRQGKWKLAIDDYRQAVKIEEDRVAAAPSDLQAQRDLLMGEQRVGDRLLDQGEDGAAEVEYRAALAIAEHLAAAGPTNLQAQRDLSVSLAKVGDALEQQGKHEPALAEYEASLAIIEPLAAEDRADKVGLRRDLFKTHESIGSVQFEQGELDAAQRSFEVALAIAESVGAADPTSALAKRELSVQRDHLGDVLEARGQLDEALTQYRKALDVRTALAAADRTNAQAQRDLSLSQQRVGGVLRKQKRWQDALGAYQASLDIAQQLANDEPSNSQWQRELATAHHNVARVLDDEGQSDAALEDYQVALAIVERLAKAAPSDVQTQRALLLRYLDVGQAQERKGSRLEAERNYCQASAVIETLINLEPQDDKWRERLAWVEQQLKATQDTGPAPCSPSANHG